MKSRAARLYQKQKLLLYYTLNQIVQKKIRFTECNELDGYVIWTEGVEKNILEMFKIRSSRRKLEIKWIYELITNQEVFDRIREMRTLWERIRADDRTHDCLDY